MWMVRPAAWAMPDAHPAVPADASEQFCCVCCCFVSDFARRVVMSMRSMPVPGTHIASGAPLLRYGHGVSGCSVALLT